MEKDIVEIRTAGGNDGATINAAGAVGSLSQQQPQAEGIVIDIAKIDDLDNIRRLYEECFPLKYDDRFYQSVMVDRNYGGCEVLVIAAYDSNKELIGAAIVQLKGRARDKLEHWEEILHHRFSDRENASASYLMTLAVTMRYRRLGVASMLVDRCIEAVGRDPHSYALYLHVIQYNAGAQTFYDRKGFAKLSRIKDFYYIDGKNYDSYIYALYFHGAGPPDNSGSGLLNFFQAAFDTIVRIVTSLLASEEEEVSYPPLIADQGVSANEGGATQVKEGQLELQV